LLRNHIKFIRRGWLRIINFSMMSGAVAVVTQMLVFPLFGLGTVANEPIRASVGVRTFASACAIGVSDRSGCAD
jgi:putative effector of murein hydrolase